MNKQENVLQIKVHGVDFNLGEALETHVTEHITTLADKYQLNSHTAEVRFTREPHNFFGADITLSLGHGVVMHAQAEASEAYPAFDLAAEKLAKRMRRYKRRLRDHHRKPQPDATVAPYFVIDARPDVEELDETNGEDAPLIIAEMQTRIESLTVSEAVMRLELADLPALTFHNRAHGGLNVIYRRRDGHISWIDPQTMAT